MGPSDHPGHNPGHPHPVLVPHQVHEQSETDDPGVDDDDDDGPGDLHMNPITDLILPPRQHSHEDRNERHLVFRRNLHPHSEGRAAAGTCVNCEGHFRLTTLRLQGRLCANCFKIYESVQATAEAHGGTFKMHVRRPGKVELRLTCE